MTNNKHLQINTRSEFSLATDFKQILMRSVLKSSLDHGNSLLITSANRQDGKSFVACNLAIQSANLGKKTLLLDTSFCHPQVSLSLSVSPNKGISDLKPTVPIENFLDNNLQSTQFDLLDVLGIGKGSEKVIYSNSFAQLMNFLPHSYDVIIIDSPALKESPVSTYLSQKTDATALVVRQQRDLKQDIFRAKQMLTVGNLLGFIFNDYQEKFDF